MLIRKGYDGVDMYCMAWCRTLMDPVVGWWDKSVIVMELVVCDGI